MTAEDRLRGRLRSAASEMPVGSGSLTGVQARAAQLQRRRNAVRGGVGAFALVAVAAIGVASLRDGGVDEYATSVAAEAPASVGSAPTAATPAADAVSDVSLKGDVDAQAGDEAFLTEGAKASAEMADEEEMALAADDAMPGADEQATGDGAAGDLAAGPDREADDAVSRPDGDRAGELASPNGAVVGDRDRESAGEELPSTVSPLADDSTRTAVFATAVSAVSPPPGADAAEVQYSLSEGRAFARVSDAWFVHDGTQWHVAEPSDASMPEADEGSRRGATPSVLHETTMLGVVTSVEVSDGAAWLKHGERVWEICPIPDAGQAHSMVGWLGEHVAIVVGVPEQSLYVLERID